VEVVTKDSGAHELVYVLPDSHGVSTRVYEYGGGAYEVIPAHEGAEGRQYLIFSDASDDNAVKIVNANTGHVRKVTGATPWLRYAEFSACAASRWVLAVEEDHTDPEPKDVRNYVVAIHLDSGEVRRLAEGADFYSSPRYSANGRWVSWRSWDHPYMPWQTSVLCWAPVLEASEEGGSGLLLGPVSTVAGGKTGEAVGESAWGLDGALYWTQEDEGGDWRQLRRRWPGDSIAKAEMLKLKGLEEVEIGDCGMMMEA
jgi:hypothetical protein